MKRFELNLVVVSDDVANREDNCVGNRKQYRILNGYSVTMGGQKNIYGIEFRNEIYEFKENIFSLYLTFKLSF